MISVIIATDNRADELKECLLSLNRQTLLPDEVIIAHGGGDRRTEKLIEEFFTLGARLYDLKYYNFGKLGAAGQRNRGAEAAGGSILFFMDDDIVCEQDFIKEITAVFSKDTEKEIGGVSGIIANQTYVPLGRINKKLFELCLEKEEKSPVYAGRLVGPAVNFLPADKPGIEQYVDWLPSCCSAYRRDVFLRHKFNERFKGYSFSEDIELSSRVKKSFKLVNTTKARCFHKDLGKNTHENWFEIGRMQVVNRWRITSDILNKHSAKDKAKFFYYQAYCLATETKYLFKWPEGKDTLARWCGRLAGYLEVLKK